MKKPKSMSQSGSAQKWAQPYATQAAGDVQGVFNANQPNLMNLAGQASGLAGQAGGNYSANQPNYGAARGYVGDVLGGKYMNGNPWLEQMISKTRGNVSDQVNSQFSLGGRYGSGAHTGVLADKMGQMEGGMRYQNYSDEMNRMGGAAGMAGQMGGQDMQQALAALGIGAEIPYTGTNALANSLGALFGGGKSKETGQSPIWGALGAGLGAAGQIWGKPSDRRLKTNITLVKRDPDGLGWYDWNWKSDPNGQPVRGVIADEVKELRPHAYIPNFQGGYDGVNYAAL